MTIREIMTENPDCCTAGTNLQRVARMMVECDCGAIPVVEEVESMKPLGIITDRDITVRTVAKGKNPLEMNASDVMTESTVTTRPDADVEEAAQQMKDHQVRRLIVVDDDGACIGMVAQADIALDTSDRRTGDVVEEISEPS